MSVDLELKHLYDIHFADNARVGDPSVDSYAEQGLRIGLMGMVGVKCYFMHLSP